MAASIHHQITSALQAAAGLYHRLVLLVGGAGSGKTALLRQLAADYGTSPINVNLALAGELLELSPRQRLLRLPEILARILDRAQPPASPSSLLQPTPLVLDNLELLFDQDLRQDPLRLLQGLARNRTLLASWHGTFSVGRLGYAEPGHPEYRAYDAPDALIVTMDGASTLDPAP
jgi:hypothetical protein